MLTPNPSLHNPTSTPASASKGSSVRPVSAPSPAANPLPPVPEGPGWQQGAYTLICDPGLPENEPIEIRVRPLKKAGTGSKPEPKIKLNSQILVEDSKTPGAYPVISSQLLEIRKREIKKDEVGDYASITVALNRTFSDSTYPDIEKFLESRRDKPFELRVTIFADMTALAGLAGGMMLPAGTVGVPIPGTTKLRILLIKPLKLSFSKFFWKEEKSIDIRKLPDIDLDDLNRIVSNGGTLRIRLSGAVKISEEKKFTHDKIVDAQLYVHSEGAEQPELGGNLQLLNILGKYDEALNAYVFSIPKPSSTLPDVEFEFSYEVSVADEIRNRLNYLLTQADSLDKILEETQLPGHAENFVTACVKHLGEKTNDYLQENRGKFLNATHGVSYYIQFSVQAAKGLRTSLEVHSQTYNKFQENIINGILEIIFWLGDDLFEKIVSKVYKFGREVVEKIIKTEAKTFAEIATESAEAAIRTQKGQAEATLDAVGAEVKQIREQSGQAMKRMAEATESAAKLETELGQKKASETLLENEAKQLDGNIKTLRETESECAEQSARTVERIEADTGKLKGTNDEIGRLSDETRKLGDDIGFKKAQAETATEQAQEALESARGARTELAQNKSALEQNGSGANQASQSLRNAESAAEAAEKEISALDATEQYFERLDLLTAEQQIQLEQVRQAKSLHTARRAQARQQAASERAVLDRLAGEKRGLETKATSLETSISDFDAKASNLDQQAQTLTNEADGLQSALDTRTQQLDLARSRAEVIQENINVQTEKAELLRDQLEKTSREISEAVTQLEQKNTALGTTKEEARILAEQFKQQSQTARQELKNGMDSLNGLRPKFDSLEDAVKQSQILRAQDELIQKLKQKGKGMTEEQYKALLDEAFKEVPGDKEFAKRVTDATRNYLDVAALKQFEADMLAARSRMTPAAGAAVDAELTKLRKLIEDVKIRPEKYKAIDSLVANTLGDQIKAVIANRAQQLRETIYNITRVEYKASDREYYSNDLLGGGAYYIDVVLENVASAWNYFTTAASDLYTNVKTEFPNAMSALEGLVGLGIMLFVGFVDLVLTVVRKFLEAILYFANSPNIATSRLVDDACTKGEQQGSLPVAVPDGFFQFSADMLKELSREVQLNNVMAIEGGKEFKAATLKAKFEGAYEMYYRPQWRRARDYFIELAGPDGALNGKWLESDTVSGSTRSTTFMLQGVIGPLISYQNSFETREEGLGSFWKFWYKGTEWTAEDLDQLMELTATGMGWALRIASLVLILYPPAIPSIPKLMSAADTGDRLAAFGRVAICIGYTMPNVLGIQFDVLRITNLAYKAVFLKLDVSTSLVEPRFIAEK